MTAMSAYTRTSGCVFTKLPYIYLSGSVFSIALDSLHSWLQVWKPISACMMKNKHVASHFYKDLVFQTHEYLKLITFLKMRNYCVGFSKEWKTFWDSSGRLRQWDNIWQCTSFFFFHIKYESFKLIMSILLSLFWNTKSFFRPYIPFSFYQSGRNGLPQRTDLCSAPFFSWAWFTSAHARFD